MDLINTEGNVGYKEVLMESSNSDIPQEKISVINLENFKILTKNNSVVLKNLILLTLESYSSYKEDFKKFIESRDQKEVGLLAHRLRFTSNLLSANKLEEVIKEARAILASNPNNNIQLEEAVINIHREFDNCINDLQKSLDNL
ncbi:MAG: hypothetical protein M3421_05170 [Bacteroidota bacterium]|jgi:CHAD domain-containing protein|nr:hypothetical protein [Bacteroidota bacterium]